MLPISTRSVSGFSIHLSLARSPADNRVLLVGFDVHLADRAEGDDQVGAVVGGGFGFLGVRRADDRRIQHIALGKPA
jgi:hypothetical protein